MEIPQEYQEFCKEVARLAKQHGIETLTGKFRPSWHEPWKDEIEFSWQQGRHGIEADQVRISSHVMVNACITEEVPHDPR